MQRAATVSLGFASRQSGWDEVIGWAVGIAFTFGLFFAMAHFENIGAHEPPAEIEDVRMVSMPFEPPPPPPKMEEPTVAPEEVPPLAGIETGTSDSPVRIAVVPRDLEALIPPSETPPKATVQFGRVFTEFKPKADLDVDVRHVYQRSEVDQPAYATVRTRPVFPPNIYGKEMSLRVVLFLVIDAKGRVESARVAESSGNSEFDAIFLREVKTDWEFSPAMRRGKRVRQLALQPFRATRPVSSPFDLP